MHDLFNNNLRHNVYISISYKVCLKQLHSFLLNKKKTIIFKYNSAVKARIKLVLLYCFYSTLSFSNLILLDYIEFKVLEE